MKKVTYCIGANEGQLIYHTHYIEEVKHPKGIKPIKTKR